MTSPAAKRVAPDRVARPLARHGGARHSGGWEGTPRATHKAAHDAVDGKGPKTAMYELDPKHDDLPWVFTESVQDSIGAAAS